MRTRKIIKIANKLVWETIWFGFWVVLIVLLVARPPMFFETYTYTPQGTTTQVEGAISTTLEDNRVVFIETISKRVEVIRHLMIFFLLLLILNNYKSQIYKELPPDIQEKYDKVKEKHSRFLKFIRW